MAQEIYVVTRTDVTPDRFDLSDRKKDEWVAKGLELMKKAGGERLMHLVSYRRFGGAVFVDRYPNIEAFEEFRKATFESGVAKYWKVEFEICMRRDLETP